MQTGTPSNTMTHTRQNLINIQDRGSIHDKLGSFEPIGFRETEQETRLASAYRQINEMYHELKTCTIDEISRSMGLDPVSIFEKEKDKKPDLETLLKGLKYFLTRMLKYNVAIKEIGERKREKPLNFGMDDALIAAEAELKTALREKEKQQLLLETAHMKIKHLEKKNEELTEQLKKFASESQNENAKLKARVKSQSEQLKSLQEENIIMKRPTTSTRKTLYKKASEMKPLGDTFNLNERAYTEGSFDVMNSAKSMNFGINEGIKAINTQMEQNKLHNLQTKHELKDLRRKNDNEREKELAIKQKDLLIARLNIQVTERDKDIARLKADYEK